LASDPFEKLLAQASEDELLAQRKKYIEQVGELQARADAIDLLISIKQRLGRGSKNAETPHPGRLSQLEINELLRDAGRPRTADAVLRLMSEHPDVPWTSDALLAHMRDRGWAPGGKTPKNSVAATLSRLKADGRVERVGAGLYKILDPTGSRNGSAVAEAE
jgi:hypothetical protein